MEYPKTLSAALGRIYKEVGASAFQNPDRLPALLADFAPNMKAERMQLEVLVRSGCAKQLAAGSNVAAAVEILSGQYCMDREKAEQLCHIYVGAMGGMEPAPEESSAPVPQAKEEPRFYMDVEDTFYINGRGMEVVGRVCGGPVRVGDRVRIVRIDGEDGLVVTVEAMEQFHKLIDTAYPGDAIGMLLSCTKPGDVRPADLLIAHAGGKPMHMNAFSLVIDNAFSVEGRGTVVTGWVQGAPIRVGNALAIVRADGTQRRAVVRGIEHNNKLIDRADIGIAVGILLHDVQMTEVGIGDVLVRYFVGDQ